MRQRRPPPAAYADPQTPDHLLTPSDLNRRNFLRAAGLFGVSVTLAGTTLGGSALAVPALSRRLQPGSLDTLVTGRVFADRGGDGVRRPGDHGIEGVAVSDGASIAVTDADGRYELVADSLRRTTGVVFVTVPAGWSAPPGPDMIPRFFRHVELRPAARIQVDFGLQPDRYGDDPNYRFLAAADAHVHLEGSFPFDPDPLERWRGQVEQFNELVTEAARGPRWRTHAPRFLAVAGDLTQIGVPEEFDAFLAGTAESVVPVWPVFGNHDYPLAGIGIPGDNPDYDQAVDGYRRSLGPEWYSFTYGRQHFVVLENMVGIGQPDQLAWLQADLALHARGREVVLMFHAPFPEADWWLARYFPDHEGSIAQAYLDVLAPYDVQLMLSGHAHVNRVDRTIPPGMKHVNTNSSFYSLDQSPLGFRLMTVSDRAEIETPFRSYAVRSALTLVHPGPGARVTEGVTTAQVSAYNTTSQVVDARFRVGGRAWTPMEPSGDWTWSAPLFTAELGRGTHEWIVEVSDDTGRSWTRSANFTVVAADELEPPKPGTAWPMFHGGASRGGHSSDAVTPPLRLAWSHRTAGTILTGSPAIAGDTVYVGIRDEHDTAACGLVAVDLMTGEQRWRTTSDSLVEASPAAVDGRVFTMSVGGTLQALDAETGDAVWEHRLDDGDPLNYPKAYSSLAVTDGLVIYAYQITGGDAVLQARTTTNGDEVWSYTSEWNPFSIATSRKPAAVADRRVYINPGNTFYPRLPPRGYDLATGKHVWSARPVATDEGDVNTVWAGQGPVVHADGILLSTYVDEVSKGPNAVLAFDTTSDDDPNELWRFLGPRQVLAEANLDGTAPAVARNVAYASLPSGLVVALDVTTGEQRWRRDLGTALLSSPAISGSTLYVGGNDGRLYALDIGSGAVRWSYELGSWVASSPAVSGNTVVVGAWDGNVYAFTAD